jgi:hypothetical protein
VTKTARLHFKPETSSKFVGYILLPLYLALFGTGSSESVLFSIAADEGG